MAEKSKLNYSAGPVIKAYAKATARYPWLFAAVILGALLIEAGSIIAPLYMSQFINMLSGTAPEAATATPFLTVLGFFGGAMLIA